MGTSRDRTSGTGGDWTLLKRASSRYIRTLTGGSGNQTGRARTVLARHVPLLGGAGGAAASARAGRAGAGGLGGWLADMAVGGLDSALRGTGLAELVGKDRYDIVEGLLTKFTGDGDDLDAQAARDAMCDVLDDVFADANSWDELADPSLTDRSGAEVLNLLEMFLTNYVYNRVPVLAERLGRIADHEAARRADREMREVIRSCVRFELPPGTDALHVAWNGPQGQQIIAAVLEGTYLLLGAHPDTDSAAETS